MGEGSVKVSGVMVWWEKEVRQCDRCSGPQVLWSVSAAEQKSSNIHHLVTLSLLGANTQTLSPACWSVVSGHSYSGPESGGLNRRTKSPGKDTADGQQ